MGIDVKVSTIICFAPQKELRAFLLQDLNTYYMEWIKLLVRRLDVYRDSGRERSHEKVRRSCRGGSFSYGRGFQFPTLQPAILATPVRRLDAGGYPHASFNGT